MEEEKTYQLARNYLNDILLLHDIPKKHSKLIFDLWRLSKSHSKLVLNSYVKERIANQTNQE